MSDAPMTFTDEELDAIVRDLNRTDDVHPDAAAAITYLRSRDAIGAVVMRERAAIWMDGQTLTAEELAQGYGFTVDYPRVASNAIRALPLPNHAEILAHALELPEIKALLRHVDAVRLETQRLTETLAELEAAK